MHSVYVLQLYYKKSEKHTEEIAIMGVYSSEGKAWEAVEKLKSSPIFNQYSINGVGVSEFEIDKIDGPISFVNTAYFTK